MSNVTKHDQSIPVRKAYDSPRLTCIGSVKQLTLKIGSNPDGMGNGFQ